MKHKPKIIHTKTFSCADDHPIVYYTFDKDNKAMCHYCSTHFIYEPIPDDVNKKSIMDDKTYNPEIDDIDYRYGDFCDEIIAVEKIRKKTRR